MRVKCLAQERNTLSPARARTRTTRSGVERTNHEATATPKLACIIIIGLDENLVASFTSTLDEASNNPLYTKRLTRHCKD